MRSIVVEDIEELGNSVGDLIRSLGVDFGDVELHIKIPKKKYDAIDEELFYNEKYGFLKTDPNEVFSRSTSITLSINGFKLIISIKN